MNPTMIDYDCYRDPITARPVKMGLRIRRSEEHMIGDPPSPNRVEYPYVGTLCFQGIDVFVETKRGQWREGVAPDGKKWRVKMPYHYGEFPGTLGVDGDPVDVCIGPDQNAPEAFVLHQKHGESTEDALIATYDEDKVMLGWTDPEQAINDYLSGFTTSPPRPGYTRLTVSEVRDMIRDGSLRDGSPLVKSATPQGGGWVAIPQGHKGGYRRPKGGGGFEYWYPGMAAHDRGKKYEIDPKKPWGTLDHGDLVHVGGRDGLYRWTPDHGEAGPGLTWVTSTRTGAHELVRAETVHGARIARKVAPPPPTRKPPPHPPKKPGHVTIGSGDEAWTGPATDDRERPGPADINEPSPDARRAKVFADSDAKEGTILHNLEHGKYMLRTVWTDNRTRSHKTVHVPDADRAALAGEFKNLVRGVAQRFARKYGIPVKAPFGGVTAQYEELISAANVGLFQALANYQGGRPFVPLAQSYAKAAVLGAVRQELGAGTPMTARLAINLQRYLAAKNQTRAKKNGWEPEAHEIAKTWDIRKKDVFHGDLGRYKTKHPEGHDIIVDQSEEQIPDGPWRVKGPTGEEIGETYPGKAKLAETFEVMLAGDRVKDSEWMAEHPGELVPGGFRLPVGTALTLRSDAERVLGRMAHNTATALRMRLGFHNKDGFSADLPEIADVLSIGGSEPTQRRKVNKLLETAISQFQSLATKEGSDVGSYVRVWAPTGTDPGREKKDLGTFGPTHNELREKFGSDQAVNVYQAAVRAGHGPRTAKLLTKLKAGKATEKEKDQIHRDFLAQRDRERMEAFKRQTTTTAVDPKAAKDFGLGHDTDDLRHAYRVASLKTTRE